MADRKDIATSRTAEQFFAEMYRDLRSWNRDIPESPERADPILRLLLQLYSNQLGQIDSHVRRTWEVATESLLKSVVPEARRWPVPAHTVMRCELVDPVVEVDPHTRFYFKEKREGGQTFFFSAPRNERLLSAAARHILLTDGLHTLDLVSPGADNAATPKLELSKDRPGQLLLGVEYDGQPSAFADAAVFLRGPADLLRQLRWGRWLPGTKDGFSAEAAFCPGVVTSLERMFSPEGSNAVNWGGLRNSFDLFGDLEDNWIRLTDKFATSLDKGLTDPVAADLLKQAGLKLEVPAEQLFWFRVDLAPGGNKNGLDGQLDIFFNCFMAVNKTEDKAFKHTGGNLLVEMELPVPVEEIVDIVEVADSANDVYLPRYLSQNGDTNRSYTLDERDGRLVLWFDFSSLRGAVPDSLTVTYTTTLGTTANGIESGKITSLYENHPGIQEAENVMPVRGAVPAKTEQQLITEVSARLRNRDRALSFSEITNWARTFDPRIKRVNCRNGIERAARGVRRCIVVRVAVGREEIYSDDEAQLLARRLSRFLKARVPANTHFKVEVVTR